MYHVELRQFPHSFRRFNLTELELREAVLDAWAQDEWVELGERKWNPHQATLTVLEGPQLPVEQLSMGRGWRDATRQGKDVTEQLLAAVRALPSALGDTRTEAAISPGVARGARQQSVAGGKAAPGVAPALGSAFDLGLAGDSLGLEALAKLGNEPAPLTSVWQLARERYPEHSASDCLKLAEHAIRSLTEAGLVVLLVVTDGGEPDPRAPGEQVGQAMQAIESWSRTGGSASVLIRKA